MRPRQWLKNLAVFAAIFFGGRFFNKTDLFLVFLTFIIFCLLSSAMYLVNDLVDLEADKIHFSKKTRPLAKGSLNLNFALTGSVFLTLISFILAYFVSKVLFFVALVFVSIQLLYSFMLKELIILDIMAIALGFMLRILAGSLLVSQPLSSWLILTVMMLALFLAIGKRRSEVTLLSSRLAKAHRHILSHYPLNFLDGLTFMMATATLITYSLFTFNTSNASGNTFFSNILPVTLLNSKWMMLTIPIVVYGIFRYLYLIFEKKEGDSPEKVLLTDKPLFISVTIWILVSFVIIYVFNS
jgi:4-hydroxybenzoate polyprenyltransferase